MIKSHLLYQLSYKGCTRPILTLLQQVFTRLGGAKFNLPHTLSAPKSLASPTKGRLSGNFFHIIAIFFNPLLTKLWEIADTLGKL